MSNAPNPALAKSILLWIERQAVRATMMSWTCAPKGEIDFSHEMSGIVNSGATTVQLVSGLAALLAQHPGIQDRLREELVVSRVCETGNLEDLEALPYLTAVIHEGLRLWKNPGKLDPERWLTRDGGGRLRVRHLPKRFAMTEARVILSETVRRFRLTPTQAIRLRVEELASTKFLIA